MSYFDPKEEVIDLKLTPYGEHLLSMGKLKPSFYAFFDNDIIYDDNWANVATEAQSEIEPRIQEQTPRMHTQVSFSDREKDFIEFYNNEGIRYEMFEATVQAPYDASALELEKLLLEQFKPEDDSVVDAKKALQPIGKFKSTSEGKAPTWSVSFLKTPLASSEDFFHISSSYVSTHTNIPQLECNLELQIVRNSAAYNQKYEEERVIDSTIYIDPDFHEEDRRTITYEDGSTISVDEDSIVLKVEETNTIFSQENFEVEIFNIKEVNGKQFMLPLVFQEQSEGVNKIYNSVDRTFDLLLDEEIPEEEICPLIKRDTIEHIFETKIYNCENTLSQQELIEDFYDDVDDTEDVCIQ